MKIKCATARSANMFRMSPKNPTVISKFIGVPEDGRVVIPENVTAVLPNAFSKSTNIKQIRELVILNPNTKLPVDVFAQLPKKVLVDVPDSFNLLMLQEAFGDRHPISAKLADAMLSDDLYILDGELIKANNSVTDVQIPDDVSVIGPGAFRLCSNMVRVSIPDSVHRIDRAAFSMCSSLRTVEIPDGVTRIEAQTFYDCQSLKDVIIPDSVTAIDNVAFAYCKDLAELIIPESVTRIADSAFEGCSDLTVRSDSPYVVEYCEQHDISIQPELGPVVV